jgi:nitroimidazol reductase NimA-like FMN-containing flavoprotein (pyridoxamine 5'-phosphate oxidase superfamily)
MNTRTNKGIVLFGIICLVTLCAMRTPGAKEEAVQPASKEAKAIDVGASVSDDHPVIEEGVTCADCHEITLDAKTTATQVWLAGNYLGFAPNEGGFTNERVKEEIIKAMGGKKQTRTCVLATCINNTPLATTAEFSLDQDKMTLHGMHEKGTAKLLHIKQNPRVSLNWHKEFTGWTGITLCVQFIGHAEIVEATDPAFEKIMIDCIPYEKSATERKVTPEQARAMAKQMMVITRIVIDEATITNMEFRKEGFRPWQRWMRPAAQK